MSDPILRTLRDVFSREVLGFVLIVGIGATVVWIVPLWWAWGGLVGAVEWLANLLPWSRGWHVDEATVSFWTALKIGYVLVTVTVSIATAVWGEEILRRLAQRHYPHLGAHGTARIHRSLYYTLKANGVFVVLAVVMLPLLFVPYLGTAILLYLWSIQLKDPTLYDVGALLGLSAQARRRARRSVRRIALLAAALNFIPLVNFFVPLFAQILFLHTIAGEQTSGRS